MLYRAKDVRKCAIRAKDGELGSVGDLFFDDRTWLIQYVVVDTGKWLSGRKVLLPREALGKPDWSVNELDVDLTRKEIERGPGIDADPPLAHDAKLRFYDSYIWTTYPWGGFVGSVPVTQAAGAEPTTAPEPVSSPATHVRSMREITDYRIETRDGRLGHVEDFLFAGEDWTVHYVLVDTRNWLPGKKVVVTPQELERMDWSTRTAHVALTKEEIKAAPRLKPADTSSSHGPRLMAIGK